MRDDHQFSPEDRQMLKQIYDAVFGIKFGPQKQVGLLDLNIELFHEIHGRKETQTIGIKQRLSENEEKVNQLWEGKIKIVAAAGGVSGVVAVVVWMLTFIFK